MPLQICPWVCAILPLLAPGLAQAQEGGPSSAELESRPDRVIIKHARQLLAEFVFDDPKILRSFFANVHSPNGAPVTRPHPPSPGKDALDHETMHPGIWLGFGDISGVDFWRNQGRIKHLRFLEPPSTAKGRIQFSTECLLQNPQGMRLASMINRFTLSLRPASWLLIWEATFRAGDQDLVFGDQEEMGFGARVASELTERAGGMILNSNGRKTARQAWGQPAAWCDYSGTINGRPCGLTLFASPENFREPWWHVRDYGLVAANPFGRAAMRQGAKSQVVVKRGESLRLVFAAAIHDGPDYDPAAEYQRFRGWMQPPVDPRDPALSRR